MRRFLLLLLLLAIGLLLLGYAEERATPRVRRAAVALDGWSPSQPPLRVVFLSDIHMDGIDMPPGRVREIVAEVNALHPDLVLLGGDFVGDKQLSTRGYSVFEAAAPLRALKARLGAVTVLGNHEYYAGAMESRAALQAVGLTVLQNEVTQRGPLLIGGLDDDYTGHAQADRLLKRMQGRAGAWLILSHTPDPFPELPDRPMLMLAGHTHCGQVSLPLVGAIVTMSRYGRRYACGFFFEGARKMLVTAGLGTSLAPIRIGAPPELWLLILGPRAPGH